MAIVTTNDKNYRAIASSIRRYAGGDATYTPEEMPEGITEVYNSGYMDGYSSGENEGERKGYDAGYALGHEEGYIVGANDFGLKVALSAPILKFNNVHPKPHPVKVSLTGEASKIITCGKNLFDIDSLSGIFYRGTCKSNTVSENVWIDENKIIHSTEGINSSRIFTRYPKMPILPAGTYRLSYFSYVEEFDENNKSTHTLAGVYYMDGTQSTAYTLTGKLGEWVRLSFTFTLSEPKALCGFWFQGNHYTKILYKDIQLEYQKTLTDYEPFTGKDYPSDVSEVESIAPNMIILTDALDCIVTAEYFVDVNALANASIATMELNDSDYMNDNHEVI